MSRAIAIMTCVLWLLPAVFVVIALGAKQAIASWFMLIVAVFIVCLYLWIWIRFRPTKFEIGSAGIDVVWPAKRRTVPFAGITSARIATAKDFKELIGFGMRVGAGGMWGAFGWLWTTKRGIVQMYISRLDKMVWIERADRPWLISPENPEAFLASLVNQIDSHPIDR